MALYEYKCPDCETSFELMRSMSAADAPAECPACGSTGGRRQLSTFTSLKPGGSEGFAYTPATERLGGGCCGGSCGCAH
ncbi:zinc ribbon domain-containing protein [Rubrobacter taiwanensis]|jgi:putative FmdB family regulatory protein|uniref:Zinc ribbon domain-containing protein n=1 Tax=Rubrobacter taiwanensis TaxID=185139 RepID=A0A4R1BGV5_9ACTN|nr:zinc ribbon domain-containing protein [Rubrobacter taiwanensis]TCJ16433.1 zinc ribbon domain-containing protein [Rubrobacter taiwanensis]